MERFQVGQKPTLRLMPVRRDCAFLTPLQPASLLSGSFCLFLQDPRPSSNTASWNPNPLLWVSRPPQS